MKLKRQYQKKRIKVSALVICLLLIVTLAVGGTLAYIFVTTNDVTNTFTVPENEIKIDEPGWEGTVKQNVTVKNTGEVKSYIRAKIVVNWQNGTNVIPATLGVDYSMSIQEQIDDNNDGGVWVLKDGMYYYTVAVDSTKFTGVLIKEAKQLIEAPEGYAAKDGYKLHIEVLAQSIQSTPDTAVDVWDNDKVDVKGKDGTLTVTVKSTTGDSATQSE